MFSFDFMTLVNKIQWGWILLCLLATWFAYWQIQGWRLAHRSGHYAPMISMLPRLVRWVVGCIGARLFIGPVTVIGWDKLHNFHGRLVVTPKHVIETDAALVAKLARTLKVRFLIAINQTRGLRGAPLAWMGAISVGYDKTNPALSAANATKSAVEVMTSERDSILLIFPEGKLDKDNVLVRENFRSGAIRIAKACQEKRPEQNWHILPVDVQYLTDPTKATPFQRLLRNLRVPRSFLGNTVYGATVTFGDPLKVSDMPAEEATATDKLFEALLNIRKKA
jgi:1-acyl-sn-glycerol-3-phosphate acyltransferase